MVTGGVACSASSDRLPGHPAVGCPVSFSDCCHLLEVCWLLVWSGLSWCCNIVHILYVWAIGAQCPTDTQRSPLRHLATCCLLVIWWLRCLWGGSVGCYYYCCLYYNYPDYCTSCCPRLTVCICLCDIVTGISFCFACTVYALQYR